MDEITTYIIESIASFGIDSAKSKFNKILDERKIRLKLSDYISRHSKFIEICSLTEEIDYFGLITYLNEHCNESLFIRVFEPDRDKRRKARCEIINSAIKYSNANTPESVKLVTKFVSDYINIIRDFYSQTISIKDLVLAESITDSIVQQIQESSNKNNKLLQETKKEILSKIDGYGTLVSIDKAVSLAKSGNISLIGEEIKKVTDHVSLEHSIYPYYGFEYSNGHIISKPLSRDADILFPPKIVLSGSMSLDDDSVIVDKNDIFDYSYRHQIPIKMRILDAKKYLGEQLDPSQYEAERLIGNTVYAKPPEFPAAFPCSIKVLDKTYFEYVLLRTQEINDDGTYIVNNKEQNSGVYFEFHVNLKKGITNSFKTSISSASASEKLNYFLFLDALSNEKDIHLYLLSASKDLLAGSVGVDLSEEKITSIKENIDFWRRVLAIEKYFNLSFNTNVDISKHEYDLIIRISDLINSDEVKNTWDKASFTGVIDKQFREQLLLLGNSVHVISFVSTYHIKLFGTEFDLELMQVFKSAKLEDFNKTKKKAEVLDDGDQISFTIIVGEDNTLIQTLNIPDVFRKNNEKGEKEQ